MRLLVYDVAVICVLLDALRRMESWLNMKWV